jgi:DNA-binding response OmpR family regulator
MVKSKAMQGHLLIVDDNRAIRLLLASHFKELNYKVTEAASAEEAKRILREHQFQFDLVLSDISMPGESGFDLLSWIKGTAEKSMDLPVLLMTGVLPDAASRLKGLALGAVDYVVRPNEITELVVRSIKAIDHYRRVRTLEKTLGESQDLAMVGLILAASNHEIKNIAALIKLSSDTAAKILTGEMQADAEISAMVAKNLKISTTLMVDITKNFKTLMSQSQDATKTVSLNSVVSETLQLLMFRTKHCLVNWNESAFDQVKVKGQSTHIKQILINLMLNSLESISEINPVEGARIDVEIFDADSHWGVRVKDNGIGFSKGERAEFKAFDTTKKLKGGQGLGLWLSNVLTKSMHGKLVLKSNGPSKGAVGELLLVKANPAEVDDFELDIETYFLQ